MLSFLAEHPVGSGSLCRCLTCGSQCLRNKEANSAKTLRVQTGDLHIEGVGRGEPPPPSPRCQQWLTATVLVPLWQFTPTVYKRSGDQKLPNLTSATHLFRICLNFCGRFRPMTSAAPAVLHLFFVALMAAPTGCLAATYGFDFHHRLSPVVKKWVESRGRTAGRVGLWRWPKPESVEYYAALARHDTAIHGRRLASADSPLTFSDGNTTLRLSSLGFLHYALVSVGTPRTDYLVALDTGSDLFWLPCDCKSCASTSQNFELGNIVFDIYSPSTSTTSKNVLCSSTYCDLQNQCSAADSTCPYKVAYVSANTSSSGVLVQDVLHLVTDDSDNRTVTAPIIFGCGQVQTGSFLDSAAINGLFGLGLERISVPSTLSMNGLISNSFSMCFGKDGLGRLRFGDKGSSDQDETPINIHGRHPTYNVTVTGLRVGNNSIAEEFYAFVDSGTSFTYLEDPAYTNLAENVNSVISDQRIIPPSTIPFEYCYVPRLEVPTLSVGLQMSGGREFPVIEQFIRVRSEVTQVKFYCLALLRSHGLNIIGPISDHVWTLPSCWPCVACFSAPS